MFGDLIELKVAKGIGDYQKIGQVDFPKTGQAPTFPLHPWLPGFKRLKGVL